MISPYRVVAAAGLLGAAFAAMLALGRSGPTSSDDFSALDPAGVGVTCLRPGPPGDVDGSGAGGGASPMSRETATGRDAAPQSGRCVDMAVTRQFERATVLEC